MVQLSITIAGVVTVTEHRDDAAARRKLLCCAVIGDYYLHTVDATPQHTTIELLRLTADRRRPRRAGRAVIRRLARVETKHG